MIVHTCHWPGCDRRVPPARWGCRSHWFKLPLPLRNRIWATYVPGQEISKTPSRAYLEAAKEVSQWIAQQAASGSVAGDAPAVRAGLDRTTSGGIGQP